LWYRPNSGAFSGQSIALSAGGSTVTLGGVRHVQSNVLYDIFTNNPIWTGGLNMNGTTLQTAADSATASRRYTMLDNSVVRLDPFGLVVANLRLTKSGAAIPEGGIACVLPEGYRPNGVVQVRGTLSGAGAPISVTVQINSGSGNCYVYGASGSAN